MNCWCSKGRQEPGQAGRGQTGSESRAKSHKQIAPSRTRGPAHVSGLLIKHSVERAVRVLGWDQNFKEPLKTSMAHDVTVCCAVKSVWGWPLLQVPAGQLGVRSQGPPGGRGCGRGRAHTAQGPHQPGEARTHLPSVPAFPCLQLGLRFQSLFNGSWNILGLTIILSLPCVTSRSSQEEKSAGQVGLGWSWGWEGPLQQSTLKFPGKDSKCFPLQLVAPGDPCG